VTATPDPLAARRDELLALRELVDAAIATRPYLVAEVVRLERIFLYPVAARVAATLDRLDAALADAGELLGVVTLSCQCVAESTRGGSDDE
jgi:hypothetical protein